MYGLRPLSTFDPHGLQAASEWIKWKREVELFLIIIEVTTETRKRAILLYQGGRALQDIVEDLPDTGTSFEDLLTALDAYFERRSAQPKVG